MQVRWWMIAKWRPWIGVLAKLIRQRRHLMGKTAFRGLLNLRWKSMLLFAHGVHLVDEPNIFVKDKADREKLVWLELDG